MQVEAEARQAALGGRDELGLGAGAAAEQLLALEHDAATAVAYRVEVGDVSSRGTARRVTRARTAHRSAR